MSTMSDFQIPPSVRGLESLAQREASTPPPIPSHYALSLSEFRSAIPAPAPVTVQPEPVTVHPEPVQPEPDQPEPVQPEPEPVVYESAEHATLEEYLAGVVRVARELIAQDTPIHRSALEALIRRVESVTLTPPSLISAISLRPTPSRGRGVVSAEVEAYIIERRAEHARYRMIADELNARAETDPSYAPPVARKWSHGNVRRIACRLRGDA